MNCEDLIHMKSLNHSVKLVAGKTGIARDIRWIYFADCMQCVDEYDPKEYIHGGELVVITDKDLTNNNDTIISIIEAMNEKNVTGFAINYGQISDEIKALCDKLELPLFELALELHLIDFSQIICKALIEEESQSNSIDRLLLSILFEEGFDKENIIYQAGFYGFNLNKSHRIIVFDILHFAKELQKQNITNETDINEKKESFRKIIKGEFALYGLKNVMILLQSDSAIMMLPSDFFTEALLTIICKRIIDKFRDINKMELCIGIGSNYKYLEEIRNSYSEAKNMISLAPVLKKDVNIYYFKNNSIYCLLMQIKDEKYLDDFMDSQLKELIEIDKIQDGSLCSTLEAYLQNNCNANATAQKLFIHRNTMRYRLEKIRNILNCNLEDSFVIMQLQVALCIKKYKESINKS